MFSHLRSLVSGRAASTTTAKQQTCTATSKVPSEPLPQMKRAKRKRVEQDSSNTGTRQPAKERIDSDFPRKKARVDKQADLPSTPASDVVPSGPGRSNLDLTGSSKRRRSQSSVRDDSHLVPRSPENRTSASEPRCVRTEDAAEDVPEDGEAHPAATEEPLLGACDDEGSALERSLEVTSSAEKRPPFVDRDAKAEDVVTGLRRIARQHRHRPADRVHLPQETLNVQRPSKLRRQAKRYLKRRNAVSKNGTLDLPTSKVKKGGGELLKGIDAWPGSSTIPGGRSFQPAEDARDRNELPHTKPHLPGQNMSRKPVRTGLKRKSRLGPLADSQAFVAA